ncbi:MAG: hypothetical protein WCD72_08875 [Dehalococcoidia bacterium]
MALPSAKHGPEADSLGRDELRRVTYRDRIPVIVGLAATSISTPVVTTPGVLIGFIDGWFDRLCKSFLMPRGV